MNNMGQNGEKMRYRVILLLVVALAAFSSAMKELNQIQQLALDASGLIAQWSNRVAPTEVQPAIVKVETCEMKQSAPAVELPWLAESRPAASEEMNALNATESEPVEIDETTRPVIVRRARPGTSPLAALKKFRILNMDPVQFEVSVPSTQDTNTDETVVSEFPPALFKAKTRKHSIIRISSRDREMLLKLNRSINVRIAS